MLILRAPKQAVSMATKAYRIFGMDVNCAVVVSGGRCLPMPYCDPTTISAQIPTAKIRPANANQSSTQIPLIVFRACFLYTPWQRISSRARQPPRKATLLIRLPRLDPDFRDAGLGSSPSLFPASLLRILQRPYSRRREPRRWRRL